MGSLAGGMRSAAMRGQVEGQGREPAIEGTISRTTQMSNQGTVYSKLIKKKKKPEEKCIGRWRLTGEHSRRGWLAAERTSRAETRRSAPVLANLLSLPLYGQEITCLPK